MKITENFTYIGTSQNFERDSYATLAEMKAVIDKRMPDIFTATCKETGKFYIYNKNNEVDETLGKWRELSVETTGEVISDSQTSSDTTWSSSKITDYISENTASQQSITNEATAREEADTALQQSISDLEASIDEKIGNIGNIGGSSALQNVKQYNFIVDNNETLLEWANCADGSMKSVLVKAGEYTLDGKEINLVNAGTKFVFAEDGNKITVSNYQYGIAATKDYGAVIVGLNIKLNCSLSDGHSFYEGMICYNCTGTSTISDAGTGYTISGFYECTCNNCTGIATGTGHGYRRGFKDCDCINCTGEGSLSDYNYGFDGCYCYNCTGHGIGIGADDSRGYSYGFFACVCSNCTGEGALSRFCYGFGNCHYCSNCAGEGKGYVEGQGFYYCAGCSNCTGTGIGFNSGTGYGFIGCDCSNCVGVGTSTGDGKGYSFYSCEHCSSCRAMLYNESSTATWGGTNTYIDSDSCDYVAS